MESVLKVFLKAMIRKCFETDIILMNHLQESNDTSLFFSFNESDSYKQELRARLLSFSSSNSLPNAFDFSSSAPTSNC
ncbi:MAG: hypothetical protein HQK77_01350 [Desulfobacterales bacterium]|nr:hypothetical protein [Desulfobacterales bacterium]